MLHPLAMKSIFVFVLIVFPLCAAYVVDPTEGLPQDDEVVYNAMELLPEATGAFFDSLTDNDKVVWEAIFEAQVGAAQEGNATELEDFDKIAADMDENVAAKMKARNEAVEKKITALSENAEAYDYLQKTYNMFRRQRMNMLNRGTLLTTLLDVAGQGRNLSATATSAIKETFPSLMQFVNDDRLTILLDKRNAKDPCTDQEIYQEMIDQSQFIIQNNRLPTERELLTRYELEATQLC
ncbi:hypothetical protein QR680_013762 [Steinernema hermaphroditum]|uniref:SXP/RAL-2 family protein Ani s 5-like cation-binding domain-containing protein n=1 Tax=Steinernema hermaphroditum TaxID=289476 RepID=A0AA39I6K1_9BILA|nr:hypothetical protein QR680_013762 [Steinernema hermaphroditum]